MSNRRQFLQHAMSSAVIASNTRPADWMAGKMSAAALATLSPDEAVQELLAGNQRFAANQSTCRHDLSLLRQRTVEKQAPLAAVLACADSRVPVELIFDQTIGQIFVTRIAGNIATAEIIASLEYAVAELGVRALLVLGHTGCGAVTAAMKSEEVPGQISSLYPHIRPAVARARGNLGEAINGNARDQAELLRTSSTVIRGATDGARMKVLAGCYDLATGRVTVL
jgi:carbonic anhydrase